MNPAKMNARKKGNSRDQEAFQRFAPGNLK